MVTKRWVSAGRWCAVSAAFFLWGLITAAQAEDSVPEAPASMRCTPMRIGGPETSAESLLSIRRNANVRIGGEFNTDYTLGWIVDDASRNTQTMSGWAIRNSNLRLDVRTAHNVALHVKFNLDGTADDASRNWRIVEEALIAWNRVACGPIGLVFGKGEVPYGQDRTLGIIQSYNHGHGAFSSEGPVILLRDPTGYNFLQPQNYLRPIAHPGEVDQQIMAGINVNMKDVLRLEFAVFQNASDPSPTFTNDEYVGTNHFGLESFAARLWWNTPLEGLVAELSGIRRHSAPRGDTGRFGPFACENEYAVSAGFRYDRPGGAYELFGEYQHAWDWNYKKGYNVDILQLGARYRINPCLSTGLMSEWMRIDDRGVTGDYNKFVAHGKYDFQNGVYVIAEYGYEIYNWSPLDAHIIAFRTGVRF